jgi:retron-type reverse transcriptase
VYKKISDIDTLITAYERLKSKPGSMTPGVDGATLDGFSLEKLQTLSCSLREETYKCKPVKRVYIPKANVRPLGIPSIDDRVVQEAGKLVLEPIFEKCFQNSSHGYRPNRSCHTALAQMST